MLFDTERKRQEQARREDSRLPPGQSLTLKWPVLHEGSIPAFGKNNEEWSLEVGGQVENSFRIDWKEFRTLPRKRVREDFHCVTTWSKFDNEWEGVPFREIHERAQPKAAAKFVMVQAFGGYTTNVPLEDLLRDNVLLADAHAPEPLTADHGGPVRLVVPHLYAWKSAKWLKGFDFMDKDRAGFWEQVGYHMYGDPFLEQRYRG